MADRAVVLARGAAGLRVGSWLAQRGVAVRWLGLGELPEPVLRLPAVQGPRGGLVGLLGPVVECRPRQALLVDGVLRPVPTRRRDLSKLQGGVGPAALLAWASARARRDRSDSLEAWCTDELGPAGARVALQVADARLGGASADLAAGHARLLFGRNSGDWWAPACDRVGWSRARREAILDGGGEVLDHVAVEGLEVQDGRVVAVCTEFGRDLVDDLLYTDLAPDEVCALLPPEVRPAGLSREASGLPAAHRVVVTVRVEPGALPWVTHLVGGPSGAARLVRPPGEPGLPRPDQLQVELVVDDDDAAWSDDDAAIRRACAAVQGVATVRDGDHTVQRDRRAVPRCTPAAEASIERIGEAWQRLGIVAVGARGLHVPLEVVDELAWLTMFEGGLVRARRAILHAGPRQRPWSFLT